MFNVTDSAEIAHQVVNFSHKASIVAPYLAKYVGNTIRFLELIER